MAGKKKKYGVGRGPDKRQRSRQQAPEEVQKAGPKAMLRGSGRKMSAEAEWTSRNYFPARHASAPVAQRADEDKDFATV